MLRPLAIKHYVNVMRAKGVSVDQVLGRTGLDQSELDDGDLLVEPEQCHAVIGNILSLKPSDGIGFDMGLSLTMQSLGILGHAAMTCKTIRDTHRLWERYSKTLAGIGIGLNIVVEENGFDCLRIECKNDGIDDSLFAFRVEEFLGMFTTIDQPLVDGVPSVSRLTLSFSAPRYEHRYRELFNCPIHFGADKTAITIDRKWFEQNLMTRDDEFNRICIEHCETVLARIVHDRQMSARLRGFFLTAGESPPRLEDAAKALNVSVRALRRRLQKESTSFREQLDAFRMERARLFLKNPDMSPKEVAYLLGFNEPSSFRHAFKAWTGQTVGEFRQAANGDRSCGASMH